MAFEAIFIDTLEIGQELKILFNFKKSNNRAFYTIKKKNFSRFSISTKTFNSVKFHIILCKSIKCYKLFEEQKKTKKGIFRYVLNDTFSKDISLKKYL